MRGGAVPEKNPLEALVEELAPHYVDMVFELVEMFAPESPWWSVKLSKEQQLWRWVSGPRNEIMEWIYGAGPFMGWETPEEILANWEKIFTDPKAPMLIPAGHVISIPVELIEMVQAAGPEDAGKHVRRMEKAMEGYTSAANTLDANRTQNVPEPPLQPPPLPVEVIPGTAGWPLYGGVPRDDEQPSAY